MSGDLMLINDEQSKELSTLNYEQFLEVRVGGQLFGGAIFKVRRGL